MSDFALESPGLMGNDRLIVPKIDLRLGDWKSTLADVEADAVITDTPYDDVTHEGAADSETGGDGSERMGVPYEAWTRDHVFDFVRSWHERTKGWIATLASDNMIPWWKDAYRDVGRYAFAAVPCVISGMGPRLLGDGPASGAVYLMVARRTTRDAASCGSLPPWYKVSAEGGGGGRAKPLRLMQAIVSDYSKPGDHVVDPCAGKATTLIACRSLYRNATGSEIDRETFDLAMARIGKPVQLDMFRSGL